MTSVKAVFAVIFAFILLFVAVLLVWATSLGYFPQLGQIFGLGTARDLGVTYTGDDYVNAKDKVDAALDTQMVQETFSDAEITALLNGCTGTACALHNAQVRTSDTGTMELSASIDRDEALTLLDEASHGSTSELSGIASYLPEQPSVYLEGTLSITDDVASLDLTQARLAGLQIPSQSLDDIAAAITDSWNDSLQAIPNTQITALHVTEQGIFLNADLHDLNEEVFLP